MEVSPGYKLTDVGVIPEDWEVKTLGQVGEALIGLTYQPGDVRTHGTLVLRSSNIQKDALRFEDNVFVEKEIPDRIMVRPGDILICVRNGSRDLIGKTALLDDRTVGMTFGAFMAVFRSTNGRFINYLFQSRIIKKQINEHLGATINQITNKSLNSFLAPLPPTVGEQRSIAIVLSDMDALLGILDQLIAKKRDLKQATMQQLLTGKKRLPGFGEGKGYQQTEIGLIPEDWGFKPLSDLIDSLEAGVSVNSVEEDNNKHGQEQSVLKTSSVSNGKFFPNECKKIIPKDIYRAKLNPQANTIIISRMNTPVLVGECGYVGNDYNNLFLPDRLWITRFKKDILVNARWLSFILSYSNFKKAIKDTATGTSGSMKNIAKDAFLQIVVPYPKEEEQTAIANVLSDMDTELAALEQRRDKTRALKQGIMQELLTGKVRLL